jgi:hypothetical protein
LIRGLIFFTFVGGAHFVIPVIGNGWAFLFVFDMKLPVHGEKMMSEMNPGESDDDRPQEATENEVKSVCYTGLSIFAFLVGLLGFVIYLLV